MCKPFFLKLYAVRVVMEFLGMKMDLRASVEYTLKHMFGHTIKSKKLICMSELN